MACLSLVTRFPASTEAVARLNIKRKRNFAIFKGDVARFKSLGLLSRGSLAKNNNIELWQQRKILKLSREDVSLLQWSYSCFFFRFCSLAAVMCLPYFLKKPNHSNTLEATSSRKEEVEALVGVSGVHVGLLT